MQSIEFTPPVIAHRGASGYAPENTVAAFIKAKQLGINWVEFDVQITSDDELVVFHDDNLERTSNGSGVLAELPYSYISTLDAGSWFAPQFAGERIPTLQEVLILLQKQQLAANIELKPLPGQEERLVRALLKCVDPDTACFLFSSFSWEILYVLRRHAPTCQIGLLMDEWIANWREVAQSLHCVSVHLNHELVTPHRMQQLKSQDKRVLCYTVNHPRRTQELFSWGVDAVFSDYPDKVL